MVAFSKITLTATAILGTIAAPTQYGPLVTFGELKSLPSQWSAQGHADKNALISAQIGLKQNNIKGLQEKLMDIADPYSPNYGKWLSREEIAKYTAPSEEHVIAVKAWLAANNISEVSQPQNDWIEFTVPVHQMESLLGAQYEWYTHSGTGLKVPRTTKFYVPEALHSMIDVVTPTTAFYSAIGGQTSNSVLGTAGSSPEISPDKIKSIYNVDYNSTGSQLGATSGLIGVGASHSDYASFGRKFVPGLKDFADQSVNNGHNSGSGDLEGCLDTQYMGGVGHPNPSQYLATGPTGSDAKSFNDALSALGNYLNTAQNPPSVVSTSYGAEERTLDGNYLDRICNEYMKAGSAGITVTFSSGDNGVGGNGESSCSRGFYGLWPASCPYITSVGGTEFNANGDEVVANFKQYASQIKSPGGGYSEHFSAPSYNKNVTTAYAKSLDSATQRKFNANNRGFPDISLVSVQFQTYVGGRMENVLGTSASSPTVASLMGILNDYRHSKGQPNLGFINPLLYSGKVDAALRDVTSGSNFGCNSNGFPAKAGWDAASGLGSFDFGKLRSLI